MSVRGKGIKVRTKFMVLTATAVGWHRQFASMVVDENIRLIGASFGECLSATGAMEVRVAKGVSDPAADLVGSDVYFALSATYNEAAGPADVEAGGGGLQMLPYPYGFNVSEDEPIFIDIFAGEIGDGGTLVLYYVEEDDWK